MKFTSRPMLLLNLFLLVACNAWSLPTTCGSTGLLNQPTAQTLNSGNICVSLWSDSSEWGQSPAAEYDATIAPFAITLGLGSFMEAYGSIPNLLLMMKKLPAVVATRSLVPKYVSLVKDHLPYNFRLIPSSEELSQWIRILMA